jgi:hypothetical protein
MDANAAVAIIVVVVVVVVGCRGGRASFRPVVNGTQWSAM